MTASRRMRNHQTLLPLFSRKISRSGPRGPNAIVKRPKGTSTFVAVRCNFVNISAKLQFPQLGLNDSGGMSLSDRLVGQSKIYNPLNAKMGVTKQRFAQQAEILNIIFLRHSVVIDSGFGLFRIIFLYR